MNNEIRKIVEMALSAKKKIIIYPFGEIGKQVKRMLNLEYGVEEALLIDNVLSRFDAQIKSVDVFCGGDWDDYVVVLASTNYAIYLELKTTLLKYFPEERIIEIERMKKNKSDGATYKYRKI